MVSPELRVADVDFNCTGHQSRAWHALPGRAAGWPCFPSCRSPATPAAICSTKPACWNGPVEALQSVAEATARYDIAAVVGLPLEIAGKLYNCAALWRREVAGIVPKTYLPTTNEFYEERWFTPGPLAAAQTSSIASNRPVPFGVDLLFQADNVPDCVLGVEICEDLWAVQPPSGAMALAGATLLLNPSASNELLGKVDYRRDLVQQQSARCLAAYLYAGAGPNESTTDTVWAGHSLIAENGAILAETERFQFDTQMAMADVDVQRLVHERLRNSTFSASTAGRTFRTVPFNLPGEPYRPPRSSETSEVCSKLRSSVTGQTSEVTEDLGSRRRLIRPQLWRTPFVPADPHRRAEHLPRDLQHPVHRPGQAAEAHRPPPCDHRHLRRAGFDAGAAGYGQGL